DKIFFTGSARVGKIVYQAAARYLTPVTLELGGKSPAFITPGCNLKMAVRRLVWAKYLNAGQTCIAPDYVLVHGSLKKKFLQLVCREIKKEKFSIEHGNYTQIINSRNLKRLAGLPDRKKIYYGGRYNAKKRFFEPTVLHNITFRDKIMQEEIFGPLLPVLSYSSLEKTIAFLKNRERPLSCYVFTKDRKTRDKILNSFSFGSGGVNEALMHVTNSYLPFGGVGRSGIGAYHGKTGFDTFSHSKSIMEKSNLIETGLKYYPHSKSRLNWIRRLLHI
ncbi:MAG TPA: aldehyde dehydrogenase family protein, partial [Spirochaetota bacterium]|nr:aldehyde dehydrogenase family protein [Spirochaetota bacterium]